MKTQHKTFAEIVGDFAGKPPSEHHYDDINGYSCLGFCYALYQKLGKDFPNQYENLTLENYNDKYVVGSPEAYQKLQEFAATVGKEIKPYEVVAGDFIIVRDKAGYIYPAVYAGNGSIICCLENCGIKTFNVTGKIEIIIARRL